MKTRRGQSRLVILWWLWLAAAWAPAACGRDVFVMLSGGDSPFNNNYSQYLQAKAMTAYFERAYGSNSVWVFFGAGNVAGEKPVFSDVLHEVKRDGLMVNTWLPGTLPHNRPATHDGILRTFREEILPAVANGGTLYLFVGDHGSRTPGNGGESIISLWGMHPDATNEHGWSYHTGETLGVGELRQTLAKGIGRGQVVFCMTQCHSGGFQFLAMPRQMTPDAKWFTTVPEWAHATVQPAMVKAAGFTATDEFSLASGCDPAPDPEDWAGYERFVPENLLGVNLFTLASTRPALKSFAEAHVAATLEDRTIDKPDPTSDQYLERWANLIETRLVREPDLTPQVKKAVAVFQSVVNGAKPAATDRAFQEQQAVFTRFILAMSGADEERRMLLMTGTRKQLDDEINPPRATASNRTPGQGQPAGGRRGGGGRGAGGRGGARGTRAATGRLWTDTIRPAWEEALAAGKATGLPAGAKEFERHLLDQEKDGTRNYFTGGGARTIEDEVFWQAGYGNPETLDARKAEVIALWAMERRVVILDWAKKSDQELVRTAAESMPPPVLAGRPAPDGARSGIVQEPISAQTAAERTMFYRRVLAAWQFLLEVNERPALARLRELTELERTPLPRAK